MEIILPFHFQVSRDLLETGPRYSTLNNDFGADSSSPVTGVKNVNEGLCVHSLRIMIRFTKI